MLNAATARVDNGEALGGLTVERKPKRIDFISQTVIFSPSQKTVTVKVNLDGEEQWIDCASGVGPVDMACGALHTIVPDFELVSCGSESSGKGSDANAIARAEISWCDMTFKGVGSDLNTLDATTRAVIDAINQLRPLQAFAGGRAPIFEDGLWAGFLIDESGGTRGRGDRDIVLFSTVFDEFGLPKINYVHPPSAKKKREISKRYHADHDYALVKTATAKGDTCHLFVEKAIRRGKSK